MNVIAPKQRRIPCPACEGTGASNEHFSAPFVIQDGAGKWVSVAFCAMCFGHGKIVVQLLPEQTRHC